MAENRQVFDEQAVLRELEQLHHAIVATRKEREHAVAKFDTFVKGFRAPIPLPASHLVAPGDTPLIRGPWVSDAASGSAPKQAEPPVQPQPVAPTSTPLVATGWPMPVAPPPVEAPEPYVDPVIASLRRRLQEKDYSVEEVPPVPKWRSKPGPVLASLAAAVAVIALLLFAMSGRRPAPPAQTASAPRAAPAATPAPQDASQPAAAPVSTHALRVELTTLRPVWMRVTVDDNKTLERQVPAGQHIPLEADRAIAVRAGDAGAVRVTVDGRDLGVLGADGQVVTRSFTPAPSATDRVTR